MPRGEVTRDTPIPFGKHKGTALRDVELGYLKWYRDKGEIDDWVEACEREIKHRKKANDERGNGHPVVNEAGPVPLQSDHAVVSAGLIEENYTLVKESLGRQVSPEAAQAITSTIIINLSRHPDIDWALVEQEQRRLHKDLTSGK